MCGFAGKYSIDGAPFVSCDLPRMLHAIIHRGPDSEGRFHDKRTIIGFRRLSIIDVEGGHQPFFNEDKEVVAVINGEIYNFKELKERLLQNGHKFRTKSDCEVIVHLYEDLGDDFVEHLNGMFAFCLYDKRNKKLLLGRDRVGIKPLYYTKPKDIIIFGSEIKAILEAEEVKYVPNKNVLDEYLIFRSLSNSRTFFSGIKILPPGTILVAKPDGISIKKYWQPPFTRALECKEDIVQLIRDKLSESISGQLMSDVSLGTQLSGGVDSGWVSVLAARKASGMNSFTIGFGEQSFDETNEAKLIAQTGSLKYHEIMANSKTFFNILPDIVWHNDEPLAHANSVEIYRLCSYARKHVKVLLTGEGADELFGGYPRYYICKLTEYYNRFPSLLRPAYSYGLDFLTRNRGKRASEFLKMKPKELVFWNAAFASPEKVSWLMDKPDLFLEERETELASLWHDSLDVLDNLLNFEFRSYLHSILLRQDKMSMGASLEARVPILDNAMVDLAFSIPARLKIKNFNTKHLFKKAAVKDLPSKVVYKRKIGFGVPVGGWMRNSDNSMQVLNMLEDERRNIPDINITKLEKLVSEHRSGVSNHEDVLWPLLNYVIWRKVFWD